MYYLYVYVLYVIYIYILCIDKYLETVNDFISLFYYYVLYVIVGYDRPCCGGLSKIYEQYGFFWGIDSRSRDD